MNDQKRRWGFSHLKAVRRHRSLLFTPVHRTPYTFPCVHTCPLLHMYNLCNIWVILAQSIIDLKCSFILLGFFFGESSCPSLVIGKLMGYCAIVCRPQSLGDLKCMLTLNVSVLQETNVWTQKVSCLSENSNFTGHLLFGNPTWDLHGGILLRLCCGKFWLLSKHSQV